MKYIFNAEKRHTVTEANINYYHTPFIHPPRKMNEHDFIYVLDGEWKIGQNDEEFELKKDSLLILTADSYHYGISPCSENTKTMYFHISKENGDREFLASDKKSEAIESLINASLNRNVKKIFYEIVNSMLSGNSKKAGILFDLLLCELSAFSNNQENTAIGDRIKEIIHKNPEIFFSNAKLAEMTDVSVKTAENKFKELYNTTIHQYMLQFKIEQAISTFRTFPEMPIKNIAYNLGFYDEYHFSKQFKRITGISPNKFKASIYEQPEK